MRFAASEILVLLAAADVPCSRNWRSRMTTENELEKLNQRDHDANRDPLSGASGAHPIGTGLGAAVGGMAAGAAVGSAAGPIGTAAGAAIGAVVGGLAGKGVAEVIDPTVEESFWREYFASRPYVQAGSFDDFSPAYRYGVESYMKNTEQTFEEMEPELGHEWEHVKGSSRLSWQEAKPAAREAWYRVSGKMEHQ